MTTDETCPDCKHSMKMHRRLDGCMVMVEKGKRVPRCKCENKPAQGVPAMTPEPQNTLVRCSRCDREERVDFARCLGTGWPKCHGYTMTMVETKADISAAVGSLIRVESQP